MANLYADENFPNPCVDQLRQLGHNVVTTEDAGQAGQAIPDDEVLKFANQQNRILVTFNRKDFIKLHNDGVEHTGIIVCTVDTDFVGLAQRLHNTLETQPDIKGKLLRVNRPNPS